VRCMGCDCTSHSARSPPETGLFTAIDQAGAEKSELFLVKLALLNAKTLGDAGAFRCQIDTALRDL